MGSLPLALVIIQRERFGALFRWQHQHNRNTLYIVLQDISLQKNIFFWALSKRSIDKTLTNHCHSTTSLGKHQYNDGLSGIHPQ